MTFFFFSSRRRHTSSTRDWSSDVCSSDLPCSMTMPRGSTGSAEQLSQPPRLEHGLDQEDGEKSSARQDPELAPEGGTQLARQQGTIDPERMQGEHDEI